ncbi:hypothetical protein LSG31_02065 [Fodinisporobacter ferrooxydans]|uniref:Uncharacterized protein n=1 Tax=Fodinisporobacter ferrooxydans TaxID=2901836 RepID=A0ABY4CKT9_9BACL|nr:hypothetical protein LSG31_02065 [Alicyclobacillaceae bacterium MYW30-H2]
MLRKVGKWVGVIALSVYLYFAYHLLVIPGALDFSFYGILGFIAACVIGILVLPAKFRKPGAVLAIGMLMIARGLDNVHHISIILQVIDFLIMLAVIGWLLRKYGRIRFKTTALGAIAVLVCTYAIPVVDIPFLSHFTIRYQSAEFVDPMTSINPAYPVYVMHGKGNAGDRIITETNRPNASLPGKYIDSKNDSMLVSFTLNGKHGDTQLIKADQLPNVLFDDFGTVGFPYDTYTMYNVKGFVQKEYRPLYQPQQILENALDLGNFPVLQTNLERHTLHVDHLAWDVFQSRYGKNQQRSDSGQLQIIANHIVGMYKGSPVFIVTKDEKILGTAHVLPGTQEQVLAEGNNRIDVYGIKSGRLLASYTSNLDTPLPGDVIMADIDGDGQAELLVNTVPARILKITPNGQWQTLWVSPKDSFRFETVGKIGNDPNVTIVANSPSEVRDVSIRYVTGYTYQNGTLDRLWRIPRDSLLFPQLVTEKGSHQSYLLVTDYGHQNMYVLRQHSIPVQMLLLVLFGLYVIVAFVVRLAWKGGRAHV